MILKVVWRVLMGVFRVFEGCCRVFEVCLEGVWKNKIEVWNQSDPPPPPVNEMISQKIFFFTNDGFPKEGSNNQCYTHPILLLGPDCPYETLNVQSFVFLHKKRPSPVKPWQKSISCEIELKSKSFQVLNLCGLQLNSASSNWAKDP